MTLKQYGYGFCVTVKVYPLVVFWHYRDTVDSYCTVPSPTWFLDFHCTALATQDCQTSTVLLSPHRIARLPLYCSRHTGFPDFHCTTRIKLTICIYTGVISVQALPPIRQRLLTEVITRLSMDDHFSQNLWEIGRLFLMIIRGMKYLIYKWVSAKKQSSIWHLQTGVSYRAAITKYDIMQ